MKKRKTPYAAFTLRIPGGPIDWKAWEAECAEASKPKLITREQVAKGVASRKANAKAKREMLAAALAAARAVQPPSPPPSKSLTNHEMLFGTMEPGHWYALKDLATVSGVRYQSCKAYGPTMCRDGWLERVQNPDWKPPERVGGKQEPKWLYRLAGKAQERHRQCRALL